MEIKEHMGQGIISVSKALFEDTEKPTRQPETLAEWRSLLMLPEEYRLLEAKADAVYPFWLLTVESEAIPVVDGKLPELSLIVRQEYDQENDTRHIYLDRIELASEQKVIWQRSNQ